MEVQYPEEGKQIANLHQGVWASMVLDTRSIIFTSLGFI